MDVTIRKVMSTNVFVVYMLILTLGLTQFYAELREFFSPEKEYKQKVAHLNQQIQREKFKNLILSHEFMDFRTHVATLLPSAIKEKGPGEKSYPLRTLASVTQKRDNQNLIVLRSNKLFADAKKHFRDGKYTEAAKLLSVVVEHYSYSPHVLEAMFLLVESHYQLREYEDCLTYINKMVDIYPDNELTGYAMIRLGKIYEKRERYEEAIDTYQTVLKSFPQRDIASAARQSLSQVEL